MKIINLLYFSLCIIVLGSCSKRPIEIDMKGFWVLHRMYEGDKEVFIKVHESGEIKIRITMEEYRGKRVLIFNDDSTIELPGINSGDLPFKWNLIKDSLTLSVDTIAILNTYSLDTLPIANVKERKRLKKIQYENLRSESHLQGVFSAIAFYQGRYHASPYKDGLDLIGDGKGIKLISGDLVVKRKLRHIFGR